MIDSITEWLHSIDVLHIAWEIATIIIVVAGVVLVVIVRRFISLLSGSRTAEAKTKE